MPPKTPRLPWSQVTDSAGPECPLEVPTKSCSWAFDLWFRVRDLSVGRASQWRPSICGTISHPASYQTTKRVRKLPFRSQLRQNMRQNMGATVEAGESGLPKVPKTERGSSVNS
jgi:hypothetical protein